MRKWDYGTELKRKQNAQLLRFLNFRGFILPAHLLCLYLWWKKESHSVAAELIKPFGRKLM